MRPLSAVVLMLMLTFPAFAERERPRVREAGITIGILPPGAHNAITDVEGVRVGHATLVRGERVRTGVTAILPHGGNLFREKVPAAIFVLNGFGKLMGATQVQELGEIESPILLTNTLSVGRVADAAIESMLALPGNEDVRSINVVVGETNDGRLNDIRGRHITREDVFAAIRAAKGGAVEGSVGAGTGTVAFGFKGGIGTSSRRLPANLGGYTVGVLVQSNFGGVLTIAGARVGEALGRHYLHDKLEQSSGDGSIMIIVATDAPVDAHGLQRLAKRAPMGLARTGAAATSGSGDYVITFSTARNPERRIAGDDLSPLFLATIEATEEAIINSLFKATTVQSAVGRAEAIDLERVLPLVKRYR